MTRTLAVRSASSYWKSGLEFGQTTELNLKWHDHLDRIIERIGVGTLAVRSGFPWWELNHARVILGFGLAGFRSAGDRLRVLAARAADGLPSPWSLLRLMWWFRTVQTVLAVLGRPHDSSLSGTLGWSGGRRFVRPSGPLPIRSWIVLLFASRSCSQTTHRFADLSPSRSRPPLWLLAPIAVFGCPPWPPCPVVRDADAPLDRTSCPLLWIAGWLIG